MADRDHELERKLLEAAQCPNAFRDLVLARLDHYEAKHGNTGWEQRVDALLAEVQEEAADIVGWGIGAAMKLDVERRPLLIMAMSCGAAAWRAIQDLRDQLAGVTAPAPAATPTFTCRDCGRRQDGPPAGLIPRARRQVPVCAECLPAYMPPRNELERFWLQSMRSAAARL